MSDFALLAIVTRGEICESYHLGDLVIANKSGESVRAAGSAERLAYFRSALKPLQALAIVQSGAAERFAFTATELAICCASHSGSRLHVETVRGLLAKLGLEESALQCGTHEPSDPEECRRLLKEGQAPSPLHNNCSGKHTGMLAVALALGAPLETYLQRDHPVQRLIAENLTRMTGLPEEKIVWGIDGCGAPVAAVPLRAIATAYARLANPDDLPEDLRRAAERVREAMALASDMIAAPGAFNSELLIAGAGRLVAKGGAEGLFAVGLRDPRALGIAIKIADGTTRALPPVVLAALEAVGGLSPLAITRLQRFRRPVVTNCHGQAVGEIRVELNMDIM